MKLKIRLPVTYVLIIVLNAMMKGDAAHANQDIIEIIIFQIYPVIARLDITTLELRYAVNAILIV